MSAFNKNGWVSLAEICDERQLVTDVETGKKVKSSIFFFNECNDRRSISICPFF